MRDDTHTVSTTQTNASDGVAQLWLAPGHYTLMVGAQNYARTTSAVDVPGPEVRVTLGHGGTIIVASKSGGQARLQGPDKYVMMNGSNRFQNVPAGAYTVQLLGSDMKVVATKPVQVLEGATVTVTFD